jgi:hypothetical protein
MTIDRRKTGGYWRYWLVIAIALAFVIVTLASNYYGLR